MKEQNSALITHIYDLLHVLQENHMSVDQLMESGGRERLLAQPNGPDLCTAYEIVAFMDEMPGGFLIYCADAGEEIVYANKALLRMFQCDTMDQFRELTGNSFRGVVHPEDLEAVEESIQTQIADSQYDLDYVEYRIIRRDGSIRWIEDYGHFVRASRNFFYVFLGDATEKWERRLAERETLLNEKREGEQKLQSLIQAYDKERALINQEYLRRLEVIEGLSVNYESIFYVQLDEDQMMPYRLSSRSKPIFNDKFQMRSLSQTVAEYAGSWVHPEDRELFLKAASPDYIRTKLAESKTYYVNYRVLDGYEVQYIQLRVVNVGRQKQAAQIVMGYRRVDEELQREMEQKQMLAQALENEKLAMDAKNTFLSNMSHDMRTPLNAIFGYTTLARRDQEDPEALRNCLDQIETASRKLLDLINKVLELSQAEGERRPVEKECDLCEIIQTVYNFLLPQAEEKGIDFTLDCSGVQHPTVCSDPEKLEQLLMYLSNNAVTYTETGGKVSITAREETVLYNQYGVYQLVVEDTGIGISEEFIEQIFEPFTRVRNTTLSGIHGIGLGLTIAKNLVDMMGGKIDVKSAEGEGSTFLITLRLRLASQELPDSGGIVVCPPKIQRILLVEDNEINRELETEILEALGFTIETAEDGSIGVEKLNQSTPGWYDLVLMDIQMPVMNGWQAAEAIRSLSDPKRASVPIIALSANVFESDIKKSIESGMDAHIPKPLDVPLLLRTIDEVAEKYAKEAADPKAAGATHGKSGKGKNA